MKGRLKTAEEMEQEHYRPPSLRQQIHQTATGRQAYLARSHPGAFLAWQTLKASTPGQMAKQSALVARLRKFGS